MVETKLLTDPSIRQLKPGPKVRWIKDSGSQSLYLVIQPLGDGGRRSGGTKSFMMRFRGIDGRPHKLVLGRFDLSGHELKDTPKIGQPLSLAGARALAADIHRRRVSGEDVIGDHKNRRVRERTAVAMKEKSTFMASAIEYIREHRTKQHGTRPRRWFESATALGLHWSRHADPDKTEPDILHGGLAERWADKPVAEIDETAIKAALDGLHKGTQRRLLNTLSSFFSYHHARRNVLRNPCRDMFRPAPPVARDRVLNSNELRWLWLALDDEPIFGELVKLLAILGQRLNEVAGMRNSELSADRTTWTIPGSRVKNHRSHVVALAPLAQAQLANIAAGRDLVFSTTGKTAVLPGSRLKKRIDRKMAKLAKDAGHEEAILPWRFHDLRRTVVTNMAELGIRPDVIELAVNHQSGARGGVAGTYNRAAMLPERKAALERWAQHLAGIVEGQPANVTVLSQRARHGDR